MSKDDPYGDIKIYHKAALISPGGAVSPLCARVARKLNLARESWTRDNDKVTCKKCLKLLGEQK